MSKARQKALEKFPILFGERMGYDKTSLQQERRNAFEKGYHQAEKDNELTWEDVGIIISINQQVCGAMGISDYIDNHQQAMEEVLKRFKERKKT